ncbi:putative protein disulfide-isomerase C1F5.02, partial [Piliocolobus tephrosceles]|uniref:putative protein disulfide-isomerase C1F5.02 n=1 Tax=Piliocolobus tephrosceles TaxID=591936 RepID=UPI000E6AEA79
MITKKLLTTFIIFFVLLFKTRSQYNYPQNEILQIHSQNIQAVLGLNEFLLIKFYAPQCEHCKRIWNKIMHLKYEIQNDNKKKVYFGEVNCADTNGRSICEEYSVVKIPQLKMFKGNKLLGTYSNDIMNESLIKKWIYYVTIPIFHGVHSEEELNEFKTGDNFFLTCLEHPNDVLIKVAKLYYDECYFINIQNQELCDKLNIKNNQLQVKGKYEHSFYNLDELDFEKVKSFVNKNRFPIVSEVNHYNFFSLRSSGNNLVLLLLDTKNEFDKYISKFTEHAK